MGEWTPRKFGEQYKQQSRAVDRLSTSSSAQARIAQVDPFYTGGLAYLVWPETGLYSDSPASWMSSYAPVAGDMVFVVPQQSGYMIMGKALSDVAYPRYAPLTLLNGWASFDGGVTYGAGVVSVTAGGFASTMGFVKNGVATRGTVIAQLPAAWMFPSTKVYSLAATAAGSGSGPCVIAVDPTGAITIESDTVSSTYLSLDQLQWSTRPESWEFVDFGTSIAPPWFDAAGRVTGAKVDDFGRTVTAGALATASDGTVPSGSVMLTGQPTYSARTVVATPGGTGVLSGYDLLPDGTVTYRQVSGSSVLVALDSVRAPDATTWVTVSGYANGWSAYDPSYVPSRFVKYGDGLVTLGGMAKGGTSGVAMFTLPAGCRPAKRRAFVTLGNNAYARIDVLASGDVTLNMGSNAWVSLEGIVFPAAG